jgi:hypothetical protein
MDYVRTIGVVGVAGGKLRPGALELARSVPHRTVKDDIASSHSAETSESRVGRRASTSSSCLRKTQRTRPRALGVVPTISQKGKNRHFSVRVIKVIEAPWFKMIDGTGPLSRPSAKLLSNRRFRSNYLGHAHSVAITLENTAWAPLSPGIARVKTQSGNLCRQVAALLRLIVAWGRDIKRTKTNARR